MEDQFKDIQKFANWNNEVFSLWKSIENQKEISLPTDPEQAAYYAKQLNYLMKHNQEKYRDREGEEMYERMQAYIGQLENIHSHAKLQ